jgi:hypothetical protein
MATMLTEEEEEEKQIMNWRGFGRKHVLPSYI